MHHPLLPLTIFIWVPNCVFGILCDEKAPLSCIDSHAFSHTTRAIHKADLDASAGKF